MKIYQSWVGAALGLLYTIVAVYFVRDDLRNTGGGWINLRGFGVVIITAPSQATCGVVLKWLGVPQVDYAEPGLGDYSQLVLHVVVTALIVYLLGYVIEWAARRCLLPQALS